MYDVDFDFPHLHKASNKYELRMNIKIFIVMKDVAVV